MERLIYNDLLRWKHNTHRNQGDVVGWQCVFRIQRGIVGAICIITADNIRSAHPLLFHQWLASGGGFHYPNRKPDYTHRGKSWEKRPFKIAPRVHKKNPELKGVRLSMLPFEQQEWMDNIPLYGISKLIENYQWGLTFYTRQIFWRWMRRNWGIPSCIRCAEVIFFNRSKIDFHKVYVIKIYKNIFLSSIIHKYFISLHCQIQMHYHEINWTTKIYK